MTAKCWSSVDVHQTVISACLLKIPSWVGTWAAGVSSVPWWHCRNEVYDRTRCQLYSDISESLSPLSVSTQRADTTFSSFGHLMTFPVSHILEGFEFFIPGDSKNLCRQCIPCSVVSQCTSDFVSLVSFRTQVLRNKSSPTSCTSFTLSLHLPRFWGCHC